MRIIFDDKAKVALDDLIENSAEDNVRIKVFYGCGKPAYDVYCDYRSQEDVEEIVQGIKFIVNKKDVRACDNIEIKYDKEVYNKGFYIKDLD